jgi:hypothetical protein
MSEVDLQTELDALKEELGTIRADLAELKGPMKNIAIALKENLAEALGSGLERRRARARRPWKPLRRRWRISRCSRSWLPLEVGLLLGKLLDMSNRR